MCLDFHLTIQYTNIDGTCVTPVRYYDVKVYVLDDVATLDVTGRLIATDKLGSKLVYFIEGGDGSGVALQGDRGPSGVRGLKGNSDGQGPSGNQRPAGKRGVGPGGPPGKIGKIGPQVLLEVKVMLENVVKKETREILAVLDTQDLMEAKATLELVVKKVTREMLVVLVHKDS